MSDKAKEKLTKQKDTLEKAVVSCKEIMDRYEGTDVPKGILNKMELKVAEMEERISDIDIAVENSAGKLGDIMKSVKATVDESMALRSKIIGIAEEL